MWFGTEDGLNRFDGYEFRQMRHDRADSGTLPNGWISSLVASEDGVWIATDGGGIVFRNGATGKLESPEELRDTPDLQRVRALARDRLGRLWIASRDAGVAIWDPRTQSLKRLRHSPTQAASIADNSIFSILHLRSGDTLVGSANGLDRLSASSLDISRVTLPEELAAPGTPLRVRALTESSDGMVWVGTDAGLARFDARSGRWRVFRENPASKTSLPDNRVQSLLIDSRGRLWVGAIRGLAWFDPGTESFYSYHHDDAEGRSLPDDYVISLYEDRGGGLWIGTKFGGLAKWNPRTWSFGNTRATAEEGYGDRNVFSEGDLLRSSRWRVKTGASAMWGSDRAGKLARLGANVTFAFKHNSYRDDATGPGDVGQTIYDGNAGVLFPAWRSLHVAVDGHLEWLQSDEENVPLSEQFYVGGARTVRGYRENQFHGRRVAYARNELRLGRSPRDGFYVFVDAGYVRQETPQAAGATLIDGTGLTGYGFGVRSLSRVGRLDLSFAVSDGLSLRQTKVHVLLEQNF